MATVTDLGARVALVRVMAVGPATIHRLETFFGDLALAWRATSAELAAAGLDERTVFAILEGRARFDPDTELAKLAKANARALSWHDPQYPERLRHVPGAPAVLFVRGDLVAADAAAVGVVGSREATAYGVQATHHLVSGLARAGVTVISGLAKGIDTIAHHEALASGGRTIAVMGSGVDVIYPAANRGLAERIVANGALVSEFPLGTKPVASNFPRRNRILSALSLGVVVVEAGEKSGALITARFALLQNREVFAVPGSIFAPSFAGANRLIRDGEAKLVTCVEDILTDLRLSDLTRQLELREILPADPVESDILRFLSHEPTHIDEIVRQSGMDAASVSAALITLTLTGVARELGGMHFALAR
ncbi:MAG: DNA-processing protein DprA [Dehalococcoidia bacterium]|nr:DNA-processing protein DprA [Dehalococcoidia bacterium]